MRARKRFEVRAIRFIRLAFKNNGEKSIFWEGKIFFFCYENRGGLIFFCEISTCFRKSGLDRNSEPVS